MGKTKKEKREERAARERQAVNVAEIFLGRMEEWLPYYAAAAKEALEGKDQDGQVAALASTMALLDASVALMAEMVAIGLVIIAKTPVDRGVVNEISEELQRLVNGWPTPMGKTAIGLAQEHLLRRRQLAHALHQAEVAVEEGAEEAD